MLLKLLSERIQQFDNRPSFPHERIVMKSNSYASVLGSGGKGHQYILLANLHPRFYYCYESKAHELFSSHGGCLTYSETAAVTESIMGN